MNSKQRRKLKRERLEMISILSQLADDVESGKISSLEEFVVQVREIEQMIKENESER